MTTQPDALTWAEALEMSHMPSLAELLRTQHAEIERKDALLRQALEAINNAVLPLTANDEAMLDAAFQAITKELQ